MQILHNPENFAWSIFHIYIFILSKAIENKYLEWYMVYIFIMLFPVWLLY